jgi:hypothetical protein
LAHKLWEQTRQIYEDLVARNEDTWNFPMNCQQFVRIIATEMLHFYWPAHIPVIGDETLLLWS